MEIAFSEPYFSAKVRDRKGDHRDLGGAEEMDGLGNFLIITIVVLFQLSSSL